MFCRFDLANGFRRPGAGATNDRGDAALGCAADEKAFSVLLDLGFGKRVQVAEDAGPLGLDAGGPHAATQFALQDLCKEGAEDVAADGFVALVEDGPCLEQGPARLETLLGFVEGG